MEIDNQNKTIDVIIPLCNQGKFILDAIKSVEAQTLKPGNIFIIDDGSTDDGKEIIAKYKDLSVIPLTYIYKKNGGPNSARNIGVQLSNAYFLAFLDADDMWIEDKLEKQIEKFKSSIYENVGLVYTKYNLINSNNKKISGKIVELDTDIQGNAYKSLQKANKILGSASSVLIKKEVFGTVGLFDENLKFAEDWDMWLRISKKYDIDFVDKILVSIRRHDKNNSKNILKKITGKIKFIIKHYKK